MHRHIHIYTYIHTYIFKFNYICVCVFDISVYVCTCTHIHIHAYLDLGHSSSWWGHCGGRGLTQLCFIYNQELKAISDGFDSVQDPSP